MAAKTWMTVTWAENGSHENRPHVSHQDELQHHHEDHGYEGGDRHEDGDLLPWPAADFPTFNEGEGEGQ